MTTETKSPADVMKFVKDHDIKVVDMKFIDLIGTWQHFSMPIAELSEELFEDGLGFDGSSIRGWRAINSSDMLVIPDATTAILDPFSRRPTMSLQCNVYDPISKEPYERDPRQIARKAEAFLKSTGLADTCYVGPEPEFFIFDDVRFDQSINAAFYSVDSNEAGWNSGRDEAPNTGYKIRAKEGYFPVAPNDSHADIRQEICEVLETVNIMVEREHHEVAAAQSEIDFRFDSLTRCADKTMWLKYVIKNVARKHGKAATFMPKPIAGDNGSGMHCHMSLWKAGKPLFAGSGYGGLSEMALFYIGGVLKHARALAAITNPTLNSYRRIIPGFEAPVNLAYSARNRSASVRIPVGAPSPKAKRIEIRFPDPMANPYLAFSALMMAGLDGIENKIHPGDPLEKDIYGLSPEELKGVPTLPGSLEEALQELEKDHEFLLKGDVFTRDLLETWIDHKRTKEINMSKNRPTPLEFMLYFDA
jgi:glutamine synthetase